MPRLVRSAGLTLSLCIGAGVTAFAQTSPLVFTVATPDRNKSETTLQSAVVVEERGLALWGGSSSDFGVGVALSGRRWTIRSVTGMTTLPIDGERRPAFQQVEIVRSLWSTRTASVAGGGGMRQEWDGTRVLIGRVLAGYDIAHGRLQGSVVLERSVSSPVRHDAADVVTSFGWARPVGDRLSIGAEGIGQDLEGLWDPHEADGGAKLLVGPSLHVQSARGDWVASFIAGPVMHGPSVSPSLAGGIPTARDSGRHFGVFVSAAWRPSLRH